MAKHRKPALPPWRDRLNLPQLALPPLVDRIGYRVYLFGAVALAVPLGMAIAGWPW
jgi:hypothetical protein